MALFDLLSGRVSAALSDLANSTHQGAVDQVARLIPDHDNGGLRRLLEQFEANGLGAAVASWVGTGANLPITPEQLRSVLGDEKLLAIAKQLGLSPEAAANAVASLLPEVVNHLTPDGQVPAGELLRQGLARLAELGQRS